MYSQVITVRYLESGGPNRDGIAAEFVIDGAVSSRKRRVIDATTTSVASQASTTSTNDRPAGRESGSEPVATTLLATLASVFAAALA